MRQFKSIEFGVSSKFGPMKNQCSQNSRLFPRSSSHNSEH